MKKITLLFLALSAVTFSNLKSEIDVTVSAVIAGEAPSITITDENDSPINSLFFDHFLEQGEESIENTLSHNLKVTGNTLRGDNIKNLNASFTTSSGIIQNSTSDNFNLASQLNANLDTSNIKASDKVVSVPLTVTSTLSGIPGSDDYGVFKTQLTVTLNKVTTTP
ncbi:hypothetical protein [Cetobacterium sp.]|uniref:hypothetical protein n=1 Tax=Cetobacterium sp. TaxID=2071632 RepID=UPI003F38C1C4